ncbi:MULTISPECIES: hypothetical protein [Olivibacter]|jgi:hypothetical protein|uniref:Uncharacterized protein n=3 Tax=Sphingobacteriaceae TaxID=84566 RepID=F4C5Q5_SPHS2|nr:MULTISPECIES: hypothetical protein [Olivibacter]MCL4637536.1 hypothetical protein [Olivibacter sp. UJ_SKK_5.1]MDM8175179.1 hypothetical protein [Olivibacter sp. 47]MDX3913144.1 hypothetical protein [Pseudosphingobacterium sp.]QEL01948.1 hypothetical protein FKG96_14405 [Olivibacter sp. LS-1]
MKAFTLGKFKPVINLPSSATPHNLISVFRTDVTNKKDADHIIKLLKKQYPDGRFNFDLEDSDKVFRIEYKRDIIVDVIRMFRIKRFTCETLI